MPGVLAYRDNSPNLLNLKPFLIAEKKKAYNENSGYNLFFPKNFYTFAYLYRFLILPFYDCLKVI